MPNTPEERRREERYATPAHVDCEFASPVLEDFGKVKVTSISRSGVGLIATEPLPSGMMLVIKLVNPTKDFVKTCLVRVVLVTEQSAGTYLIGGILDTPLSYDELCALIM